MSKYLLNTFFLFILLFASTAAAINMLPPDSLKKNAIGGSNSDSTKTAPEKTMGQKMENIFKYVPVPMYSYSIEGGNLFGLAKFNAFQLKKSDTISQPSIISGVGSITTKGRINASLATQLVFNEDKIIVMGFFNYRKQPEYLTKIGNTVYRDNEGKVDSIEAITFERIRVGATVLRLAAKNLYLGGIFDYAQYLDIETDTNSFLARDKANGLNGGTDLGIGFAGALDARDNRYNASKGHYVLSSILFYPKFLGSSYQFTRFVLDARKFYNPWYKHVIAVQVATQFSNRDVPFYNLALLGGDNIMRGYYQGFLRDKVLINGQAEYRMPLYKMFGLTAWIGAGRTAPDYKSATLDGLHLSYGAGFRVRVDSKNNINMRVDFGFGPNGVSGTYINFAEAF